MMSQRVEVYGKVKGEEPGAEGKPSVNSALSRMLQTRNQVSYPWPG